MGFGPATGADGLLGAPTRHPHTFGCVWYRCEDDDMVPELDANRVRRWAHDKTPPEFRDDMRVEVDETPRGLTILECRPPWSELMGSEWTRASIARLAYSKKAGEWTLYYADRNDRFQRYWECGPSPHVVDLLEEIDADPTCIFWG
jgi:hypothetical protein